MSSARIKGFLNKVNMNTLLPLLSGTTAVVGSAVLSNIGVKDHNVMSAVGMAALGSGVVASIGSILNPDYNFYSLFREVKTHGIAKSAAALLLSDALSLMAGTSLFLLRGKTLQEVGRNSADFCAGSILLALPMAFAIVEFSTKLLNDFEAEQKRIEKPRASFTLATL